MDLKKITSDWRGYENFIAGLFVGSDSIKVERNVELTDKDGSPRQIDCLVTVASGPHSFRVVVECKSGNKPVERCEIDKLLITKEKVDASQAYLFANAEFQSGAINTAESNGIRLFTVHEATSDTWWPKSPLKALFQVWSIQLQSNLTLPWREVGIGIPDGVEWPKGIQAPQISFYPNRTHTEAIGRQKSLEDLVEDAVHENILDSISPQVGVINNGFDCVGHFTIACNVSFERPIVVRERDHPPVFLQIPKLTINAAVKIEQRSLLWKAANELDGALLVDDVTRNTSYQVGRDNPGSMWAWIESSKIPLGSGIGNNRRIVVITEESFRPECFDNPWTTFNDVNIYELDSVPESKTIQNIVQVLSKPPADSENIPNRRRQYNE